MSRFITDLQVKELSEASFSERGSWELLSPLVYESDVAKTIICVPKGFKTDFASIPRLPFVFWILGDRYRKPAVIHDYLYGTHELTREEADGVLFEASKCVDVEWENKYCSAHWYDRVWIVCKKNASWLRRGSMWVGLRLFGWTHWGKE